MTDNNSNQLYECTSKYLGSTEALHPKIGTLENAAKVYQKGCYDMRSRQCCTVRITPQTITVEGEDTRTFEIRKTLFCATYKKIPKVVVLNYLSGFGNNTIRCHALLVSSLAEAQDFVMAVTTAFSKAYSNEDKNERDENEKNISPVEAPPKTDYYIKQGAKKHSLWSEKLTDIIGTMAQCVSKDQ